MSPLFAIPIFILGFFFGFFLAALASAARIGDIELELRRRIFELQKEEFNRLFNSVDSGSMPKQNLN